MLEVFGINKHQWIAHWQAYSDVKYLEDMKGKKVTASDARKSCHFKGF